MILHKVSQMLKNHRTGPRGFSAIAKYSWCVRGNTSGEVNPPDLPEQTNSALLCTSEEEGQSLASAVSALLSRALPGSCVGDVCARRGLSPSLGA